MLSVIIITKNESLHIRRCLKSVSWADEIIVYDSGSEDETVSICKEFTPNVFITDWPGFGPQKQRALNKATHDWVLSIDADELISESLKNEILSAIKSSEFNGFEIPFLSFYCGKLIKHGGWKSEHHLRLFKRHHSQFTPDIVHENILVQGKVSILNNPIMHYSYTDQEEVLRKINTYSTLGAENLFRKGHKSNIVKATTKGLWMFFRNYFIKVGFLDGTEGLMLAISSAEGTFYKYLKLRDLHLKQNHD